MISSIRFLTFRTIPCHIKRHLFGRRRRSHQLPLHRISDLIGAQIARPLTFRAAANGLNQRAI